MLLISQSRGSNIVHKIMQMQVQDSLIANVRIERQTELSLTQCYFTDYYVSEGPRRSDISGKFLPAHLAQTFMAQVKSKNINCIVSACTYYYASYCCIISRQPRCTGIPNKVTVKVLTFYLDFPGLRLLLRSLVECSNTLKTLDYP